MRYLISLVLVISLSINLFGITYVESAYTPKECQLNLSDKDIMQIDISVKIKPIRDSKYCYEYSTTDKGEIIYIVHWLNSFKLVDTKEVVNGGDISIVNINITMNNEIVHEMGFIAKHFIDSNDNQYMIDENEYQNFIEFIYALKTKNIIMDNEVAFEPSEWAQKDIDKAISYDLVPEWNQIGYTNDISRVEVCQLIDNLLTVRGIDKKGPNDYTYLKEYSFDDTRDISVKELYLQGIINGKSETEFCPYDYITREEFSRILSKTYKILSKSDASDSLVLQYKDKEQISDWAVESIGMVTSLGLMQGDENGNINPKDNITKEQVIVTLLRLDELSN